MNATELFFSTIQSGKLDNIILQLKNNPQLIHAKDNRGFTPLIFASYFGQDKIAKHLIMLGADINAKDASGNTALMGVCFKGNVDMANYLISNGAAINTKNNNGITPLIFSVMYNKIESVQLLLKHNADPSIKDALGKTAMDYAKEKDFETIVEALS